MPKRKQQNPSFLPEIRMNRLGALNIYQISEDELNTLATGAPYSLYLNFGIGLMSTATSFLICLLTNTIRSDRTFTVFVLVTLVGYIVGAILLVLWWKTHTSVSRLVENIRNRLPPEGESQTLGRGNA